MTRLLLYIEPTPYTAALLRHIVQKAPGEYDVWFISRDVTQAWGGDADVPGASVLWPAGTSWRKRATRALQLLVRIGSGRYRAVHLAGWGHPVLILTIVTLKLRRIPFTLESDTQLRATERGWRAWMKKVAYPVLFRWPVFVLPAGHRQAALFQFYGVSLDRIRVARMTVDIGAIQSIAVVPRTEWRRAVGLPEDAVVVLFVGRLEPHKGIGVLIEAFERLASIVPRPYLVLVGGGSLEKKVRSGAVRGGRLRLAGRCSQAEVVQWMRSSGVLVLPSTFEPWGLVVNEAMACGLPVVATDAVGAGDDLVEGGANGLIVPAGDTEALARALEALVSDPERRRRMGAVALERIASWTIEREATVVEAALEGVAGE